ncbi:unnamed protein product [Rhizoctonia solani]|uniref:Uncharacterized protein n=1 Tax=Rhizoctonia solani TaxID=456999 RepID=A0A8H2X8X8_9AGAM|nr:unnamed protein product [Rhizoctonia solani]
MDTFETYPPLPPSPTTPLAPLPAKRAGGAPPYIRTSFSSGYSRSYSAHNIVFDATPVATSPSAPNLRHHSQSREHRHSKSMNLKETPPPLPLPKEALDTGYTSNNEYLDSRTEAVIRQWRMKRSETDPGLSSGSAEKREALPSLPDNPRIWTPSQLAQYLLTALRFKGNKSSEGVSVPKPVAQDIANFVVKHKLNGRVFLRLQDRDIEEMGINQLWRTVLMSSSLELRKSLLKGRIWGFGFVNSSNESSSQAMTEHERRVPSTVLEREEAITRESTSPSCEHLPLSGSQDFSTLRSSGYMSPSSSTLSFDSDASNYIPSRRSTRPRAESTSSVASSSAGRVREIVQNLERAASSSEDVIPGNEDAGFASGEMTSGSEEDREPVLVGDDTIIDHGPNCSTKNEDIPSQSSSPELNGVATVASPSTSYSSKTSRASTSELIKTPPPPSLVNLPALVYSRGPSVVSENDFSGPETKGALAEEPSVEALLQEGDPCEGRPRSTSWGARAWEEEFPGGTSRRVPVTIEISKTGAKALAKTESSQEMITVPRSVWDNLRRRLEDTERRITLLEMQEAERRGEVELLAGGNFSDDRNIPKAQLPGGLSVVALSPCLVIVGVGVCALAAEYVFGHVVGRRSRS